MKNKTKSFEAISSIIEEFKNKLIDESFSAKIDFAEQY
jgi:hypothetical protein